MCDFTMDDVSTKNRLIYNAISNVLMFLILGIIFFFLTPVILHRLGDERFGIWTFAVAIMGYSSIASLGLPSALVRYFSHYYSLHKEREVNEVTNSAMSLLIPLCFLVFLLNVLSSTQFAKSVMPSSYQHQEVIFAFILVGSEFALLLILQGVRQIIFALEKIVIYNAISIGMAIMRAMLIYHLVQSQNILMLCLISLLSVGTELFLSVFVLRRLYPKLKFGFKYVAINKSRLLLNYGIQVAIMNWAYVLTFSTNLIVIGLFISTTAVGIYSIATRLLEFERGIIGHLTQVFIPRSSALDSLSQTSALRNMCLLGTKYCFAIALLFSIYSVYLGETFIDIWIKGNYSELSWQVLVILSIGQLVVLTFSAAGAILVGIGRQRLMCILAIFEGIAHLILSIVLARVWGILGVAIGTTVPYLVATAPVMVYLLHQNLNICMTELLRFSLLPVIVCGASLSLILHLFSIWFQPSSMTTIAIVTVIGGAIYTALFWIFAMTLDERNYILQHSLLSKSASRIALETDSHY
ncbi:MAG: oligosaccharide flippase family protein [Caldilineaceae bacterium]